MFFSSVVIPKVSLTVINSKDNSLNKEENPLDPMYIPYVKGFSEKFKHMGSGCNIRMISKTIRGVLS
jgi:hypothetical protein